MKFSIKDFFSNYDQIWSHLLKKSLLKNVIFCAVIFTTKCHANRNMKLVNATNPGILPKILFQDNNKRVSV